jgi:hypothetical protein
MTKVIVEVVGDVSCLKEIFFLTNFLCQWLSKYSPSQMDHLGMCQKCKSVMFEAGEASKPSR